MFATMSAIKNIDGKRTSRKLAEKALCNCDGTRIFCRESSDKNCGIASQILLTSCDKQESLTSLYIPASAQEPSAHK